MLIKASKLRDKKNLNKISNKNPGYYKWYANLSSLKKLLNSKYISKKYIDTLINNLSTIEINNKTYYYIYVGISVKESIQDRLDWHVNQKHSISSVQSGFLSTLRQTLSSLISMNQYEEIKTNQFIDSLYIDYYEIDLPIKSNEAKELIESIEKEELNNNLIPLNLKDNKNELVKPFLRELSAVRKRSK